MEGYSTDSEQIEALKNWWRKNGRYVVAGLVVAALVVGGWKGWDAWQARKAGEAAGAYASVVLAEQQNDLPAIVKAAHKVVKDYPDTAYGALASLALAKVQFVQKHYGKAEKSLHQAIANAPDRGFASIARLRLARIQLQQGKAKEALQTLDSRDIAASFAVSADTLRGEALVTLGRTTEARQAWRKAQAASDPNGTRHRLLAMRIASLPAAAGTQAAGRAALKAPAKATAAHAGSGKTAGAGAASGAAS